MAADEVLKESVKEFVENLMERCGMCVNFLSTVTFTCVLVLNSNNYNILYFSPGL